MLYKAKVAVCSDIRTKHSAQSEHHAELLDDKTWWYVKKPLGFKRLNRSWTGCRAVTNNFEEENSLLPLVVLELRIVQTVL
jgi:hypothetical protein